MKPKLNIVGLDGNVFAVVGAVKALLPRVEGTQMQHRVFMSRSYGNALAIMAEYVDFVGSEKDADDDEDCCDLDEEEDEDLDCTEEDTAECNHCGRDFPESELNDGYCDDCYALMSESDEHEDD